MMQIIQKLNRLIHPKSKGYKSHYIFENTFSDEEVKNLLSEMSVLSEDPKNKKPRATDPKGRSNFLCMVQPHHQLFHKMVEKIDGILPFPRDDYDYFSMNFYRLQIPYALHCDNLGEDMGHYQIVIPLYFEPVDCPPHTILFDQTSPINTEWISPAFNKSPDYVPHHNKPIYDPKYYPHWTNEYKISEAEGLKYWGPWWDKMYREAYKGFSIKYAYQWKVGDLFLFDSRYNHCASFLDEKGLAKTKTGMLVCLQQPRKK